MPFNINPKSHITEYPNIICTKYAAKNPNSIDCKFDETKKSAFILYRKNVQEHFIKSKNIRDIKEYYRIEKATAKYEDGHIVTIPVLDWLTDGDSSDSIYSELIAYTTFFVPKHIGHGSSESRQHTTNVTIIKPDGTSDVLVVKSMKSKDNNCSIVCFTNQLKRKEKPNTVRERLNIPLRTSITIEQLELLVDYFKCDIKLYTKTSEGLKLIKQTNRYDKLIELYLEDNHYFVVTKHSLSKDYGTCSLCQKPKCNNGHKCNYDDLQRLKAERMLSLVKPLTWNDHFNNVVDAIKKGMNVIISGSGGSGKSYMLLKLSEMFNIYKTASTGVASVNISGSTIHSALVEFNENICHDAIVIDEISMIDGATFDRIYMTIQKVNSKRKTPISLIICGDVLQLPPVDSQSGYFFNAHNFNNFETNAYTAKLNECKRQEDKEFIDIQRRIRIDSCTENDIRYIQNMKNNHVDENNAVYMSAKNENVCKINKRYFDLNNNPTIEIGKRVTMSWKDKDIDKMVPVPFKTSMFGEKIQNKIKEFLNEYRDISIKKGLVVMVTKNINVSDGLCNGTIGVVENVIEHNKNKSVVIKTDKGKTYTIDTQCDSIRFSIDNENHDMYKVSVNFMPLIQCNAITIHKSQSATIDGYAILDCEGIFEDGMFYVGISRIKDPKKLMVKNFRQEYIRCNNDALRYELENYYESYVERKLVADTSEKQVSIRLKSMTSIFEKNTIVYDYECASKGIEGHTPYFNHMVKIYNSKIDEEKTLIHYENTMNVNKDTFEYVMQIVSDQCNKYLDAKDSNNKKLMKIYNRPLYLCGFNNANYDLYFLVRELLKSKYADRFISKTIFKGNTLIFFMLIDTLSGKIALKSHDIYQITLASLDDSTKSYVGKECKGLFPHKMINNLFFNDPHILKKSFNLTMNDFYKRDHDKLHTINLNNYNIKDNLLKYAKNDTYITLELYRALNKICYNVFKCDIVNFLTVGQMANYGLMTNLPKEITYKKYDEDRNKLKEIHTKLYRCDKSEDAFIREAIYGGKSLPRIHSYESIDKDKNYEAINDFLTFLDISGMYVYIMKKYNFPYNKSRYASKSELEAFNQELEIGDYSNLFKNRFFIADVECQPNDYDLEPPIGRHENGKLIWDCTKRTGKYTSIDLQTLINSKGKIYKVYKMLIWEHDTNIFTKWMNKTIEIKNNGEEMNEKVPKSGNALGSFGKLLENAAYGDTIRGDHQDNIQFIKSIKDQREFLEENELKNIIPCDDDDDGFHVFIGNKLVNESKYLSGRPSYLGAFVLSYSRVLLNEIITTIYGKDRYTINGIKKQVYTGDTDSLVVHCSQVPKLINANMIGDENGKLTDDLNKKFVIGDNKFQFAKITEFVTSAPKKYALKYVMPNDERLEKITCNGISKKNMKFINPFNSKEQLEKLNFDIFRKMYMDSQETFDVMGCKLYNNNTYFTLPDKMKRISFKRTHNDTIQKVPMFSIHSAQITRALFHQQWKGRQIYDYPFTIPLGSAHENILNI